MSEVLAQVSKIFIYPIKSLPGIELEKAFLTKNGISCFDQPDIIDRKWMIVDEDGSFLSQRKDPKMALIKQTISDNRIVLTAPFMEHLPIPIKLEDAKKRQCRLWTEFIDCLSYGKNSKISKWLSEFLGKENLDLVYFPDELLHLRSKAEFSTFMLVSEASLADLNTKLTNQVTMRNFRPNIVVKGCEAFAEDKWNLFKIDNTSLILKSHCLSYRLNEPVYGVFPMFGIYIDLNEQNTNGLLVKLGDCVTTAK